MSSSTAGSGLCTSVANGGVGESGSFEQMVHVVSGPSNKNIVLRCTNSSLCPNTTAVGMLIVNGRIAASGSIPGPGHLIQASANAGDKIVAILQAVPLFNNISCVRLGELEVQLDECELGGGRSTDASRLLDASNIPNRDWYAWNNKMPPKPDDFHVIGEIEVPNPGIKPVLAPRVPQGINPQILLLDLFLLQEPGIWPQQVTTKQVRYDKVLVNSDYTDVQVFVGMKLLAQVSVDTIQ